MIMIELQFLLAATVLAIAAGFIVLCFGRQRDAAGGDLRAPLLFAGEHRVEAAVRDAELGFVRCAACAFENFKRFPFCSLCGQELTQQQGERGGGGGGGGDLVACLESRTLRQKRVRSRKEWTRKLDVEGRMFWYRDALTVGKRYAGYCLSFTLPEKEPSCEAGDADTAEKQEEEETRGVSADLSGVEPSLGDATGPEGADDHRKQERAREPKPLSKDAVLRSLDETTRGLTMNLTESSTSDPAQSPLGPLATSDGSWSDRLLRATALDFPSKYAEFVSLAEELMAPGYNDMLKMNVTRELLFEDSIESLSVIPETHVRSAMRINFVDEPGLDAGGLQREWFMLLNERLADATSGVFKCIDPAEQVFYLNPRSAQDIGDDHLLYYFAVGRLVGRALLEGQVLGFHFALPLLKIILGLPVSFTDLEFFDPEAYKSLLWIHDNDGVGDLGLTFSITEECGDETVEVDLIEDGRNIDVTDENKELYLERRFRYLLFESVSDQLYAFLKGVYEVVPPDLLAVFDPEELDYVLCGSDEIDVNDWELSTKISDSLSGTRKYLVKWFWEIVREMPNEYRRRLLRFATGSSRVPLGGFSALMSNDGRLCPFTLKLAESPTKGYIWSHACFNRLDLPTFRSKDKFELVLYATLDTEIAGFTTN